MFSRHKWPSFEGIALIIIMVISLFSFVCKVFVNFACSKKSFFDAFFTSGNKVNLFSSGNLITGNMVKVTGMKNE